MVKTVLTIMGVAFLLLGVLGFILPNLLGTHLSLVHNLIHLGSGAVSLYFGLAASLHAARLFALIFGAFYLLLGVTGFLFGTTETITLPAHLVAGGVNQHMFRPIPGVFELGTMDHVVHLLLGALYIGGGLLTRRDVRVRPVNP